MDVTLHKRSSSPLPLGMISAQAYANIKEISLEEVVSKIESGDFEGSCIKGEWYLKPKSPGARTIEEAMEEQSQVPGILKVIVVGAIAVTMTLLFYLILD